MKYFKFKKLIKKRKAFANIEMLFGSFLNKFADGDKKLLLSFFYNVNTVITFASTLAPIFIYELIYYIRSSINPIYISTIYFFGTLLITEINNDDYDPAELENVSQWMYKAQKNKFRLLIIEKLLFTFGTKILFYCFFIIIFMKELYFSFISIILFECLILLTAWLIIVGKLWWSNYQIIYLFIHGPNYAIKKEYIIKYKNDKQFNKYQIALSRSCQNRTYYLYILFSYIYSLASIFIIWILNYHFDIKKIIIISVYSATESALINFLSQGIINCSKMLNDSNLSDFYYIKKFNKNEFYNKSLSKFLSKRLLVLLFSYYIGDFILYGFSYFTAIAILYSTIIYYCSIKIITKRVFRFKKFSIEDVKNNFFVYFFNPIEDLFILGLPVIICSALAVYSIKLGSAYPIIFFFIVYSIFLLFYDFLVKER